MRQILYAGLLITASTPAWAAEFACHFDQECFAGDACAETSFAFEIEETDQGTSAAQDPAMASITTDAETIIGVLSTQDDGLALGFASLSGPVSHTLTVAPDGAAQYITSFVEDGFFIGYYGTCEAIPG